VTSFHHYRKRRIVEAKQSNSAQSKANQRLLAFSLGVGFAERLQPFQELESLVLVGYQDLVGADIDDRSVFGVG
jgi:hypothetical protein